MDFLREFSVGINFIEITIDLAIVLYMLEHYRRDRDLMTSGVAAFGFLSFAFMRIFYIIYDYYYISENLYLYLAWTFLGLGNILIISSLFKGASRSIFYEFPHKTVYFIGFVAYFIFIIAIIRPLNSPIFYIGSIGIGIFLLIPLLLRFNKLFHKVGGYIKRYFSFAIIGLPLSFIAIGIGPIWVSLPEVEGWILKIGAHFMFLFSLILLAIALLRLPSLNEFDWEKTLNNLHIILPNGACIYSFNFKETKSLDPQLLGSGLTGIVMMVQEMTRSLQRLSFIKQEQKNLYVEYGKQVTFALIGEEELKIIFEKMEKFREEFERIFPDVSQWTYSTEEFKITNMLVRNIFAI